MVVEKIVVDREGGQIQRYIQWLPVVSVQSLPDK
jgi:hypothetical protein